METDFLRKSHPPKMRTCAALGHEIRSDDGPVVCTRPNGKTCCIGESGEPARDERLGRLVPCITGWVHAYNENGELYCTGQAEHGVMVGNVTIFGNDSNGSKRIFEGRYDRGLFVGTLFTDQGRVVGSFKDQLAHGQCHEYNNRGELMATGRYEKGAMHGADCFFRCSTFKYFGPMREGVAHGEAKIVFKSGCEVWARAMEGALDGRAQLWYKGRYLKTLVLSAADADYRDDRLGFPDWLEPGCLRFAALSSVQLELERPARGRPSPLWTPAVKL